MSNEDPTTIAFTEEVLEIALLKARLARAEEEVDVFQYNNKRLTKRLEEVMTQLKTNVTTHNILSNQKKIIGQVLKDSSLLSLVSREVRK